MAESTPTARANEVRIRLGGPAGFGIKAAGQSLARVFARAGYHTFDLTEYPSLIKGGHNTYHLRVSAEPVFSHVLPTDVLVCLDRLTAEAHAHELTQGAAVVYDPAEFDAAEVEGVFAERHCLLAVPLDSIVRDAGGVKIMRNVCALGAVLGFLRFPLDPLLDSIREQFARKAPEIAEQNVAVATVGYERAAAQACAFESPLGMPAGGGAASDAKPSPRRLLVDGNEAFGLGALAAGVGLYCAYPMTPASSLLHFFAKHGDQQGVVVKHTEDEIAAMNMVVGGAFGGTRSMCATSGGGFSLMVEALGLAGVSESAVVVGLFTRPGPATGMPTWTEQSDLRFALHAAQGEFPRVVLAPGDHAEAFELTWRAFNLADQLQTPVILLGDSYLSDNRSSVEPFDLSTVSVDRGRLVTDGDIADHTDALAATGPYQGQYTRYEVTDDGVSVRALPGVRGATQVVNSYEHDEKGYGAQGEVAATRVAQSEKRMRKLDLARALVPPPARFGPDGADLSIVFFGTTKMPVLQAMKWLADDGVAISALQVVTVWPFPAEQVSAFLDAASISLVIEGNASGQLEGLVREQCLHGVDHHLRRYDGRPFSPEGVYAHVRGLLGLPTKAPPSGADPAEVASEALRYA